MFPYVWACYVLAQASHSNFARLLAFRPLAEQNVSVSGQPPRLPGPPPRVEAHRTRRPCRPEAEIRGYELASYGEFAFATNFTPGAPATAEVFKTEILVPLLGTVEAENPKNPGIH